MTYGHLQADWLYTGISSGPSAQYRVWEAFTFTFLLIDAGKRRDISYRTTFAMAPINQSSAERHITK